MRGRAARLTLWIVVLALLLCGCGTGEPGAGAPQGGVGFVDALGQEHSIHSPRRVVALMGGFAETWLLAGGSLVGVTTDAIEERGLALDDSVAVVGTYNAPDSEAILNLDPDLVLLSAETAAHLALGELLAAAGIPAAYFRVNQFEDYLEMLRVCTQITGRKDLYEQHGEAVGEEIERLLEQEDGSFRATALLMITYSGGAAVQDSGTMAGRMLAELGWRNLADEHPGLLTEFSMEFLLEAEPDYIFVIAMGNDEELARRNLRESIESHPAWSLLTAVQEERYLLLPKELFLYKPNARWGESYAYLAQIRAAL